MERNDRITRVVRAVQAGVHWLKQSSIQTDEPRAIAVATSALIAAERNPLSHLVQRLVRSLIDCQLPNGSWNDELWDTTHAVRALVDAGRSPASSEVQRALRFFIATQDPLDGTWYEDPFETMLVLDLLVALDPENWWQCGERSLKWLASLQRDDGLIVGTRYTGMAVSLFQRVSLLRDEFSPLVERGAAFLSTAASKRGIWTAASWSNYYPLRALIDTGRTLTDPAVSTAVDWFLDNQDESGRWMQVSAIHDTAMAVLALGRLMSVPIIDVGEPHVAVLQVSRENGTLRVGFSPPGAGAIVPSERVKISEAVRAELGANQQELMAAAITRTRSSLTNTEQPTVVEVESAATFIKKVGQYTYCHLIPPRIQALLERSDADHLRLDIDERLIDLPWELIHDGREFLCLRYAASRRLVSDQPMAAAVSGRRPRRDASALVVANPTEDLPEAELEGARVADQLRNCGVRVDFLRGREVRKQDFLLSLGKYDIVHFAGHADRDRENPDESCLLTADGNIQAFEVARFLKAPVPSVVFLNACWSAEELRDPDSYSPMMRGLGRTFMYAGVTAFVGYLIPVPDESATRFALEFYSSLTLGRSIGESVRRSRIVVRETSETRDLTWASAVLYGEPSVAVLEVRRQA